LNYNLVEMKKQAIKASAIIITLLLSACSRESNQEKHPLEGFLVTKSELKLNFHHSAPVRKLSWQNYEGDLESWRKDVLRKFSELTGYVEPGKREVEFIRSTEYEGIKYSAFIMKVSELLSIPAYLLEPAGEIKGAVMAIHGHGAVEPLIGLYDDYHHMYGLELAREGYLVLAPELRGFSTLGDLAWQEEIDRLDYWNTHGQFSLVTDGFLHGETLIGKTIEDLVAWENWFFDNYDFEKIDVAGISYGGDLALFYPAFSKRVRRIFSSGSLGSFDLIFSRCYNAPAHCIPDILLWMDRSDVAGLNAPRPVMLHYGELDTPSVNNYSASYNESSESSFQELKEIYRQVQADEKVIMYVTQGSHHEMDNGVLVDFLDKKTKEQP
jgi:dienelactone hydrolase